MNLKELTVYQEGDIVRVYRDMDTGQQYAVVADFDEEDEDNGPALVIKTLVQRSNLSARFPVNEKIIEVEKEDTLDKQFRTMTLTSLGSMLEQCRLPSLVATLSNIVKKDDK